MEAEDKKMEFEGNWNINVDEDEANKNKYKLENESEDEEESDWSDMEEMEELRKDFKKMILEDQDKKKKKFKNYEKNKKQNPPPVTLEIESTADRLCRFDVTLEENETMTKIGQIEAIVNDKILIQSVNNLKLEPDNCLFAKSRQVLGEIEEILGSVKNPKYLIKIDSYLKHKLDHPKYAEVSSKEISVAEGEPIFAVSRLMKIMNQDRIVAMSSTKGTDYDPNSVFGVSQMNNQDMQFSDDEAQNYHANMSKKRRKRGRRRKHSNSNMSVMSTQSVPLQTMQPIHTMHMQPMQPMQPMPGMQPQGAFMIPNFQAFGMAPNGFVMPVYQPQANMFAQAGGYAAMSNQINQMYGYNVARGGDLSKKKENNN